jgi:WD40 repeat protein
LALIAPITVGRIIALDPSAGREARVFDKANVVEAAFLPDGKQILSVGSDGLMRLLNTDRGTKVKSWGKAVEAKKHLTLSAVGKRALAAGDDGTMRLWDVEAGNLVAEMWEPKGFGMSALSPNGKSILISHPDYVHLVETPK